MAQSSDEDEKPENPYQDPNYPELEFVNYDDPEYQVDMGVGDEFFDSTSTEERVEEMREERRVKNDEFQFETYYRDVLKEGKEFKGEWTVFRTSTFLDGELDKNGRPRLSKAAGPFKVISRGERVNTASDKQESSSNRLEFERILHHEKIFNDPEDEDVEKTKDELEQEELSMSTTFWPDQMSAFDFRGQQGIMCVGNSYTICTSTPLGDGQGPHEGPFATYSAELGITSDDDVRFRIKMDYSVVEGDKKDLPPLHLKSFTICRETLEMWPRAENYKSAIESITQDALFGRPCGWRSLRSTTCGHRRASKPILDARSRGPSDRLGAILDGSRSRGTRWNRMGLDSGLDARTAALSVGSKNQGRKRYVGVANVGIDGSSECRCRNLSAHRRW